MRCYSCNCALNDFESTRKSALTGEFIDLCNECYKDVEQEIPCVERDDLNPFDLEEED